MSYGLYPSELEDCESFASSRAVSFAAGEEARRFADWMSEATPEKLIANHITLDDVLDPFHRVEPLVILSYLRLAIDVDPLDLDPLMTAWNYLHPDCATREDLEDAWWEACQEAWYELEAAALPAA